MKKTSSVLVAAQTVLCAVLVIGIKTVFHACTAMDGNVKTCVCAQNTIFAVGIGMLILSAVSFLYRNRPARSALSLTCSVFSVITMLIPNTIIPLCAMPDMHCLTVMKPAVQALSLLILIVSVISAAVNRKEA